jgi:sterol desaturase/sphingolipid hydroxylase (fatty acid hydroxylase superfamily)
MFESIEISQVKTIVIIGVLIGLLLLERIFPFVLWSKGLWRMGRNFGLSGFNAILSPLIVLPIVQFADGHSLGWRGDAFNAQWMIIIDLLILDLWIYWWHRINHVSQFLWRFHEVHHLDDTLDATSALRFHFGEVFLSSLVRAGVIILLDIPFFSVVIFEILVAVSAMFHHSNVRLPKLLESTLSYVIVTPKMHWVHHHALRADTDSNYSAILSVWDKVFGSASATKRTADMPIGVEGLKDRNLISLLIRPFRKK